MCALRVALVVLSAIYAQSTSLPINPTTTLTAETANNTSAANTWTTSSSGDLGAGNVSKVDHRTLLYSGATTQIYTNIMFWFGQSNHISVGYSSNDYNQVKRQVDDHLSRGITGTIVDWYGTGHSWDNSATMYLKQYAETLAGYPFKFAIMEDKGALLSCSYTAGCDLNSQLVSDLSYVVNTYGGSPAYMKFNNQPVIFFFGLDVYSLNWDWVKANVPGNPLFIFQNASGFTHADSAGAFSWVMINTSNPEDWKQSYLDYFYQQALSYPAQHSYGTVYKGFNDTLASWSLNRIMDQQCGQVWLNTWSEVGKYYNSGSQLESMQIVTWNDYEEGTEIESGIDNCVSVTAAGSSDTLSWTLAGNENTVDHYTVFISADGENLMSLAYVGAGIHALDLSPFGIGPGNYVMYVKAVGKPSFANHISPAVSLTVANPPVNAALTVTPSSGTAPLTVSASTANSTTPSGSITGSTIDFGDGTAVNATTASHTYNQPGTYTVKATVTNNFGATSSAMVTVNAWSATSGASPDFGLTATPASAVVKAGESASFTINVTSSGAAMPGSVALSCSGLPPMARCNFSPANVQPGSAAALTIATAAGSSAAAWTPLQRGRTPMFAVWLPFLGLILLPARRRIRRGLLLWLWLLIPGLLLLVSCGGTSNFESLSRSTAASPGANYTITISGQAGTTHTTTLNLTIN